MHRGEELVLCIIGLVQLALAGSSSARTSCFNSFNSFKMQERVVSTAFNASERASAAHIQTLPVLIGDIQWLPLKVCPENSRKCKNCTVSWVLFLLFYISDNFGLQLTIVYHPGSIELPGEIGWGGILYLVQGGWEGGGGWLQDLGGLSRKCVGKGASASASVATTDRWWRLMQLAICICLISLPGHPSHSRAPHQEGGGGAFDIHENAFSLLCDISSFQLQAFETQK